ncbi:hypothetical protein GCM10027521_27500 [Amycolatopsis cihanbeyliensis]
MLTRLWVGPPVAPCARPDRSEGAILQRVEIVFTTLLVLAILGVTWFGGYVVYRLYSDQR